MAVEALDVHNFQPHGFAANVARLEALGFGDPVGDDIDANLLEVVIYCLQGFGQRAYVAGRIELGSHLAFGAQRQEAQALLDSRFGFGIGDGRGLFGVGVQADKEVELIALFRNRVTPLFGFRSIVIFHFDLFSSLALQ